MGYEGVYNLKGGIKAWQGLKATGPKELNLELLRGDEDQAEVIVIAYGMEMGLQDFYRDMAESKDDPELRRLFNDLAGIEEKHKQMLLGLQSATGAERKGMESIETEANSQVLEGGFKMAQLMEENKPLLNTVQDVIELAMMLETQGLDLYMRFAEKSENEKAKEVLFRLSDEEKGHLAALGRLLDEKLQH